jgi:hypothetical protein
LSFENRYSGLDRIMHRLAFASPGGQRVVAELEDRFFAAKLAATNIDRPVFVTALPRAGTTLLLEVLASLDEFASHSYRNMPFVLCPLFWSRLSSRFHREDSGQERAHQDGMLVTVDSPEAFEEMVWMPFWKSHYAVDRIRPWVENDPEFAEFMRSHMKKIVLLAGPGGSVDRRYLSKNNLNIARIPLLSAMLRDARFVVPFRQPLQHAASLLRQHLHFSELHRRDSFARRYMAGIGHFDFGANFRPVDFGGWLDQAVCRDPATIGFWVEYWVSAYRHLCEKGAGTLVCYEDLCSDPAPALESLADSLQVRDVDALVRQASRFRPAKPHTIAVDQKSRSLLRTAEELYETLRAKALTPAAAPI